jgi:hypothetical protein
MQKNKEQEGTEKAQTSSKDRPVMQKDRGRRGQRRLKLPPKITTYAEK